MGETRHATTQILWGRDVLSYFREKMKAFPIFIEMNEGILGKLEFHAYIYIYTHDGKSCPTSVYQKKKKRGGKSINFLNQQKKLEEENSDHLLCLTKTQKFPPPFQDPGAPILTGWALIGLGFSSGTLRGRGCGVCTGVKLCTFFSGWGTTGVHVPGCFFFLCASPGKGKRKRNRNA